MYSKIQITGEIELVTGLHIGGSSAFSAIGAVDNPIVRDVKTNLPMIPGSSLKGKVRTLLARKYCPNAKKPTFDSDNITKLFGNGKLLFRDMVLSNADELRQLNIDSLTEVKFENTISRFDGKANPRQMERAVRGSKFNLDLVYEFRNMNSCKEDLTLLAEGLKLLQYDYLGGSGSRGYGKVKINGGIKAECVAGDDVDKNNMEEINKILETAVLN